MTVYDADHIPTFLPVTAEVHRSKIQGGYFRPSTVDITIFVQGFSMRVTPKVIPCALIPHA